MEGERRELRVRAVAAPGLLPVRVEREALVPGVLPVRELLLLAGPLGGARDVGQGLAGLAAIAPPALAVLADGDEPAGRAADLLLVGLRDRVLLEASDGVAPRLGRDLLAAHRARLEAHDVERDRVRLAPLAARHEVEGVLQVLRRNPRAEEREGRERHVAERVHGLGLGRLEAVETCVELLLEVGGAALDRRLHVGEELLRGHVHLAGELDGPHLLHDVDLVALEAADVEDEVRLDDHLLLVEVGAVDRELAPLAEPGVLRPLLDEVEDGASLRLPAAHAGHRVLAMGDDLSVAARELPGLVERGLSALGRKVALGEEQGEEPDDVRSVADLSLEAALLLEVGLRDESHLLEDRREVRGGRDALGLVLLQVVAERIVAEGPGETILIGRLKRM